MNYDHFLDLQPSLAYVCEKPGSSFVNIVTIQTTAQIMRNIQAIFSRRFPIYVCDLRTNQEDILQQRKTAVDFMIVKGIYEFLIFNILQQNLQCYFR